MRKQLALSAATIISLVAFFAVIFASNAYLDRAVRAYNIFGIPILRFLERRGRWPSDVMALLARSDPDDFAYLQRVPVPIVILSGA